MMLLQTPYGGLPFPAVDPVAFSLFGLDVRWYGLAYIAGFFCALAYGKWQVRRYPSLVTAEHMDGLFTWGVLGAILGGRLGYTLFYNPQYYLHNPVEIFYTWQGGMSYHGGMLGVIVAILLFARFLRLDPFAFADRIAPAVCLGLLFGRLANFINGELYGRITDVPWAIAFPSGGLLPRHPSQLYEGLLEGVVLFAVLHFILTKRHRRGEVTGLFLLGYGAVRVFVEFFRQPDDLMHLKEGVFTLITMGQLLSVPMIIAGGIMWWWSRKQNIQHPQ